MPKKTNLGKRSLMPPEIVTDSNALDYRIYVHKSFSRFDMDQWVLENLQLDPGMKVLDIGCGTGKHLFLISQRVGKEGLVFGGDVCDESLEKCKIQIKTLNYANIRLIKSDMVDIKDQLEPGTSFHRILSSFSLYYTRNAEKTLRNLHQLLQPNGIFFICGPTKKNNLEFLRLIKSAGGRISEEFNHWTHFLEKNIIPALENLFSKVEITFFKNPIEIPSPDILYNYWKATALYEPSLEANVIKTIEKHFRNHSSFITHKVVIGIKVRKNG